MPGVWLAHSLACKENTRVSHRELAETIRHSPRNGFNGFLRGLPGDRAFLPPSPADHLCRLDTSVEVSGRHDFAVRFACSRLLQQSVHRIPRPTFVTIAKRPLLSGRDGAGL
jgi:hypothetical protein